MMRITALLILQLLGCFFQGCLGTEPKYEDIERKHKPEEKIMMKHKPEEKIMMKDIHERTTQSKTCFGMICSDDDWNALQPRFEGDKAEKIPTVSEYFLEAVDFLDRSHWRFFLPDDTDIDQDGSLSDIEVEHKFLNYLEELFKMMDQDKDSIVTEEELVSLRLRIPDLSKIIDISLENYPLKSVLLAADGNGDGFYDERDFNRTGAIREIDPDLAKLVNWRRNSDLWEEFGRFLFLADANQDEKLSLEEIAAKAKSYLAGILEFLDQNEDGHLSVKDFTYLNIKIGKIHEIFDLLLNDIFDRNNGTIDLFNLVFVGRQHLSFFINTNKYDKNGDQKLNAADFFWRLNRRRPEKISFLIPMGIQKLDKNQDGKIKRQEIKLFINEIWNKHIDMDGSGALTLVDIYSLMKQNGFDCFQVGALRSFINVITNMAEIEFEKLMVYIFKQLDQDRNGQIIIKEFQKLHVPCAVSRREFDPNTSRMRCSQLVEDFLGDLFAVGFPDLEMKSRRGNDYDSYDYRRRGDSGPDEEITIVDRIANAACEIMT